MNKVLIITSICLAIAVTSSSFSTPITIELGNSRDINPDPYIVDIPQMGISSHSEIELLVENIEDPTRYKEWELIVWIPEAYAPLTHLDILDYEYGDTVKNILGVSMAPDLNPDDYIPGYNASYADTSEDAWYQYGTQPVGADWGRVDIGNPAWVSFHFYADVPECEIVWCSLYDECIPEPATICILGLGALSLIRRKKQ